MQRASDSPIKALWLSLQSLWIKVWAHVWHSEGGHMSVCVCVCERGGREREREKVQIRRQPLGVSFPLLHGLQISNSGHQAYIAIAIASPFYLLVHFTRSFKSEDKIHLYTHQLLIISIILKYPLNHIHSTLKTLYSLHPHLLNYLIKGQVLVCNRN